MLDMQAIIEQVQSGAAPQSWRVFRAKFTWLNFWVEVLLLAFFVYFIVTNFPEMIKVYPHDSLLEKIAIPIIMIVIVLGGAAQIRKIVEKRHNIPTWMLVITDDGILQYMEGEPRKTVVVPFSDARISTLAGAKAFWVRRKGILSDWRPNRTFGTYQELLPQILVAFETYQATAKVSDAL